jgi:hypothetical protein
MSRAFRDVGIQQLAPKVIVPISLSLKTKLATRCPRFASRRWTLTSDRRHEIPMRTTPLNMSPLNTSSQPCNPERSGTSKAQPRAVEDCLPRAKPRGPIHSRPRRLRFERVRLQPHRKPRKIRPALAAEVEAMRSRRKPRTLHSVLPAPPNQGCPISRAFRDVGIQQLAPKVLVPISLSLKTKLATNCPNFAPRRCTLTWDRRHEVPMRSNSAQHVHPNPVIPSGAGQAKRSPRSRRAYAFLRRARTAARHSLDTRCEVLAHSSHCPLERSE